MKSRIIAITTAALVFAAGSMAQGQAVKVVAKDAHGHATEVQIDGRTYAVCSQETQDDCINPRAASLNWGNRALDYWPGKPASETQSNAQVHPE